VWYGAAQTLWDCWPVKARQRGENLSPISEKHIVFFGDSITEFGNYPELVGTYLGAKVSKLGFGGTRLACLHNQSPASTYFDPFSFCALASYIKQGDWGALVKAGQALAADKKNDKMRTIRRLTELQWEDVDLVVLGYGTNDYGSSTPIGKPGDIRLTTFCGAFERAVSDLLSTHPHLSLLVVTPFFRARGGGAAVDRNRLGASLYDYADALIDCSRRHHVECFDLLRLGGVSMCNHAPFFRPEPDLVHPSAVGYNRIASKVAAAISSRF
jgi:lysophospholipase L1-like esterase